MKQTTLTLTAIYDKYKLTVDNPVPLTVFRKVCFKTNQKMFDYMQEGKGNRIDLPPGMGQMQYFRYKKQPVSSKGKILYPINWLETKKLWADDPSTVNKNFIYYINNWNVGVRWLKGPIVKMTKWIKFLKFQTSRTNGTECKTGNKNKIVSLLKENELYYLNFPEYDIQFSKLQRNYKQNI